MLNRRWVAVYGRGWLLVALNGAGQAREELASEGGLVVDGDHG
jgi:hypothetical protein